MNSYDPIIGLEVHIELATKSKMFCGCPADHFGQEPNTITCPVCLGLPGALPVPNRKAVEWTILLGLALGCTINEESKFDRKHYFYPDLPKGYQISQYDQPLCVNGWLDVTGSFPRTRESSDTIKKMDPRLRGDDEFGKRIRIRRVHLEEDTGKLLHQADKTLVDFNRSGVPLVEIVTEPDFRSVDQVDVFVKKLQQIVRYLGISSADMEKGSMRIEPSVSIRKLKAQSSKLKTTTQSYKTEDLPRYRVEIKNINSFKFARRAIAYEIERQRELLAQGQQPEQQTRGFVEAKGITVAQREKEEAHDYRYFPEPDIPPMRFTQTQISKLKAQIGELPDEKKTRFMKTYDLNDYDAGLLVESKGRADFFENVNRSQESGVKSKTVPPKTIANWIINRKIDIKSVSPTQLLEQITRSTQLSHVSDEELDHAVKQVLAEHQKAAKDYQSGKEQALMFLVGQAMKISRGKLSPDALKQKIIDAL